jgi:two-component system OmpR family sensor kinase
VSRVPIRIRIAVATAVTMGIVLSWACWLLYVNVGRELREALDSELRLRAHDLALVVDDGPAADVGKAPGFVEPGERYAQLLDPAGAVREATDALEANPLLGPAELSEAKKHPIFVNRSTVPGLDEPSRFLAVPVRRADGTTYVLIVGSTREDRVETLHSLRRELLIGGPAALVIATIAGYFLAGFSLRQVDLMRRRAATISAERLGERLPVPRTNDEVQRLGETLNDMLARLEIALQRERGFVSDAGHELRTPLALVRAELDLALRSPESADALLDAVRRSAAEVDRLTQLAEDLLLIATADGSRLPLRREVVDVREVLGSVANRFQWRSVDEAATITVKEAMSPIHVEGDRLRLEQAIGNLVDNALRHGGGSAELSAAAAGDIVEIRVSDRGPGIPPEFLAEAFERFSRADHARGHGGAGLGLSIVRAVAEAHGGTVRVRNREHGGAELTIALPARVSSSPS